MDAIDSLIRSTEESSNVEFKSEFDIQSTAHWCEVIKDVLAIANSGGGVIVIGVNDDGSSSDFDTSTLSELDGATVDDKLRKYVEQRPKVRISTRQRNEKDVVVLECESLPYLVPFVKPGEYELGPDRKKSIAFAKGTIYYRHGPKSEPCEYHDIQDSCARALENVRRSWLDGVVKITEAPIDKPARVVIDTASESELQMTPAIRLTADSNAPQVFLAKIAATHPMNATQLAMEFSVRAGVRITVYDVICLRDHLKLEGKPEFYLSIPGGSPRYGSLFLDWLVAEHAKGSDQIAVAREARHAVRSKKSGKKK